jgi:hypothetical protein
MNAILKAIDAVVNPKPQKAPPPPRLKPELWQQMLDGAPMPTSQQIKAIAHMVYFGAPEPAITRLKELQVAHEADVAAMLEFTPRKAREAFQAHTMKLADSIVASRSDEVSAHDAWSLEDWESDFYEKVKGYKIALKRHSAEAMSLAAPHYEEFAQSVAEHAETVHTNEQNRYADLFLDYKPSPYVMLLRKTEACIRERIKTVNGTNMGNPPRLIADFLI